MGKLVKGTVLCFKYGNFDKMREMFIYDSIVSNSLTRIVLENANLENQLHKLLKNTTNQDIIQNCQFIIKTTSRKFEKEKLVSLNFELKQPQLMDFISNNTHFIDFMSPYTDYSYTKAWTSYLSVVYGLILGQKDLNFDLKSQVDIMQESLNQISQENVTVYCPTADG